MNQSMGVLQWMLLVLLSLLWGGSFFFIGVAVRELPPLSIVAGRVLLAAGVLWLVVLLTRQAFPWRGEVLRAFVVMGFLNNLLPFTLIVWGQTHIAGGLASILNATTPLFTVLIAHVATQDERLNLNKALGMLMGFLGVVVLMGWELLARGGDHVMAELAVICAALSYAVAGIYGRRFAAMGLAPITTATGQLTASALLLLPLALFWDRPWTLSVPTVPVWLALSALAILSTSLAYILYFRILKTAGATNLLLVTFLIPVSAVSLGVFFLDESLAAQHMVGMALIGAGLLILDGRWVRRLYTHRK